MANNARLGVAIIGCGLIGQRRAAAVSEHNESFVRVCVDTDDRRAEDVAGRCNARTVTSWQDAVGARDVDVVVVATPNSLLAEIGCAALRAGKHVLIEKPMGRNYGEALQLGEAAEMYGGLLKIGFNHRYHPAIARAYDLFREGVIGRLINMRARYGHGGRPGLENEWRADPAMAGGGELIDQGVHIADLFQWFAGPVLNANGVLQTAAWPIAPLEDNAFGIYEFGYNVVGSFHVSMTQWKNLFSLEIAGECGTLAVDGLGGSYGKERLTVTKRRMEGGVPEVVETTYDEPDKSWAVEWSDFVRAINTGAPYWGTPADGVEAMRMVDLVYRSATRASTVELVSAD